MTFLRAPAPLPLRSSPTQPVLSRREMAWGWTLLITFVLLVSLPCLWCALLTPEGMTWGGLFFSADDQNVHLMWAKQAQQGAFFIRDLFTTEGLVNGDRPLFFNLFSFSIGNLARTGIDVVVWYHIARVAFAGLFVHQLHRLLVAATGGDPAKENVRLGALALATLTTGAGFLQSASMWLSVHAGWPPFLKRAVFLDSPATAFVTVPEGFALTSALIYPLNIASFALLCFLLRALIENRQPAKAFFAALVLSNIHTYDALPLLLTCLVGLGFSAWRREIVKPQMRVWSAVFIGLLLPVLYQALVFRGSEEFRVKALTPTSPPVIGAIFSTFAPLLILSVWSWRSRSRWTAGTAKWLLVYALSVLTLVYLPKSPLQLFEALFVNHPRQNVADIYLFSFARKMIEGFQIPLLVFAGAGLASLPKRKWTAPLVVGICALSPLIFWKWTLVNALENNLSRIKYMMPPYSLTDADAGALLALQKVPDKNQAVLCLPLLGSYVPRATGLFTYTGHWAETLHILRKTGEELRFYQGRMTPSEARAFLKANRIGFIIESPFERSQAPNPSVAGELGFKTIYSRNTPGLGETKVFEVK